MRSRLVACLVAVAVLVGGCSLPTSGGSVVVGPVELPPPGDLGDRSDRGDRVEAEELVDEIAGEDTDAVVLVGPDDQLVIEERPARLERPADAVRALDTLLMPLSPTEVERGRSTEVPSTTTLVDLHERDRDRVEVELSADFDAPDTEADVDRRLAQVACTVAAPLRVSLVEITIEGRTLAAVEVDDCPSA